MDSRFWGGWNSSKSSCLINCQKKTLHRLDVWLKRIIGCATGNNGIDKQIARVVGILTVFFSRKNTSKGSWGIECEWRFTIGAK
jgi:hypothetical protein